MRTTGTQNYACGAFLQLADDGQHTKYICINSTYNYNDNNSKNIIVIIIIIIIIIRINK